MSTQTNGPRQLGALVFSGKKAAGKDTVSRAVVRRLGISNPVSMSFADPLKDEVDDFIQIMRYCRNTAEAVGVLRVKYPDLTDSEAETICEMLFDAAKNPREHARSHSPAVVRVLQFYGTDVRRKQDPDHWVNKAVQRALAHVHEGSLPVFTDARYPNEVGALRDQLGATLVRLEVSPETQRARILVRDGYTPSDEELGHPSETALDGFSSWDVLAPEDDFAYVVDYVVSQVLSLQPSHALAS